MFDPTNTFLATLGNEVIDNDPSQDVP